MNKPKIYQVTEGEHYKGAVDTYEGSPDIKSYWAIEGEGEEFEVTYFILRADGQYYAIMYNEDILTPSLDEVTKFLIERM